MSEGLSAWRRVGVGQEGALYNLIIFRLCMVCSGHGPSQHMIGMVTWWCYNASGLTQHYKNVVDAARHG